MTFSFIMVRNNWRLKWALGFLSTSVIVNSCHYAIFKDGDYLLKFIAAQLGFLPISVLLVTIVINQLLAKREKQNLLNKLNMVIGTFFSEVGHDLIRFFAELDSSTANLKPHLLINNDWGRREYSRQRQAIGQHQYDFHPRKESLQGLRSFLQGKRAFLLGLLRNPTLLEHETFTDLLWAVFHLTEELSFRADFSRSGEKDLDHLIGDMDRAYKFLLSEWISYMQHLQADYPYLFSLAVRTNPFDAESAPEIY